MITVAIPIGPNPVYLEYLDDCIQSIVNQEVKPAEVFLIEDQSDMNPMAYDEYERKLIQVGVNIRYYETIWNVGVATAFNFGVAEARNDLVIMLGSDDRLEPWAIRECLATWERHKDPLGYYWMDVKYSTGEEQSLPCNAAMVHKDLWRSTGGFPVETAVGLPDSTFISTLMTHPDQGHFYHVESEKPPYWYRQHEDTDTHQRRRFRAAAEIVRDIYTETGFERPTWT